MEKAATNLPKFQLTRYAPTPSGLLHLGNVYSFILTYHLANKYGAKILLRIDDIDRKRVRKTYIEDIFTTLDFLELPYHAGPKNTADFERNFSQIKRFPLYMAALETIKSSGILFACDCSRRKIKKMNPKGFYSGYCHNRGLDFKQKDVAWRIRLDSDQQLMYKDLTQKSFLGKIPKDIADCVLKRKDGLPAYQLTSLVDDLHFGTDLIVRGQDLWSSSLAQVYLSGFLPENNFSDTVFVHHPLITGPDLKKLSKSSGATSIQYLRKSGKKKEDIFEAIGHCIRADMPTRSLDDFSFLKERM
jgi:glutamyl/glutaminyl-tRNA synthetase